jgi:hypothetical protein
VPDTETQETDRPKDEYVCETCGRRYTLSDEGYRHFDRPDDYQSGYTRYCLACWLGVGPTDFPEDAPAQDAP